MQTLYQKGENFGQKYRGYKVKNGLGNLYTPFKSLGITGIGAGDRK